MPYKTFPPLYSVWQSMLERCRNPKIAGYARYGGRGIKVCDRWLVRENFVADMGPRPVGMSLDRIDNDGDYEPSNCRWATRQEQQRNQSCVRTVTIEGKTYKAVELAEKSGLKTDTIVKRAAMGLNFAEVTSSVRKRDTSGLALGRRAAADKMLSRTHCTRGHEYTPENTYRFGPAGHRLCRACHAMLERNKRKKNRAAGLAEAAT